MPVEQDEDTIVLLTDPQASFVSLVKRGANKTPFKIVKQEKNTMKIIQRIVTRKGVTPESISEAVMPDAADALNLKAPQESGAFVQYVQHPEDAFKSDSLEVVDISGDRSILAICGELAQKSEGFVSKLLARKSNEKGVEVPDTIERVDAEILKSDLSGLVWTELDALYNGIRGILCQASSEGSSKKQLAQTMCDNFLKSMDVAISVSKSDEFVAPSDKSGETAEDASEPVAKANDAEATAEEASASTKTEAEEVAKSQTEDEPGEAAATQEAPAKIEDVVAKAVKEAVEQVTKSQADLVEEAVKPLREALAVANETIEKMQRAPSGVVADTSHDGLCSVSKSANDKKCKQKADSTVFAGCFGPISVGRGH